LHTPKEYSYNKPSTFDDLALATNSDSVQQQIDSIVGEAIKGLVESGADAAFVGAFAARHRAAVSKILGATEAGDSAPPDLLELVAKGARLALEQAGLVKNKSRDGSTARRISVMVAGKRTTVSVATPLMQQLVEARGDEARAIQLVQDIAKNAPADAKNRSAWLSERLRAAIVFSEGAGEAPRH
jgi:hypothetical protein